MVKGVRQRVCENKRRFQADGYDLDLTYVTTHIIAMSFPSKGQYIEINAWQKKLLNIGNFPICWPFFATCGELFLLQLIWSDQIIIWVKIFQEGYFYCLEGLIFLNIDNFFLPL